MLHDFHPVLLPAVKAMEAAEDSGKVAGLERALRHIAAEAERIAATYANMGSDHAGPLFNRVMGNQASDGAYFTRPVAASIAARLTLDAAGDADWTDPRTWRSHKTVDLACGSGMLLAAMLTDMKRRARAQGASDQELSRLQKVGVEDACKGLDINPVSLQLAASQLTAGNQDIRYRRMGLHQMPYGPPRNGSIVRAGTLELLLQKSIVSDPNVLPLPDDSVASRAVWNPYDDAELEDAADAVSDARIVIMNPPFTNRSKMGEKFPRTVQTALRNRADAALTGLTNADPDMTGFGDKNSIAPLFMALADRCAEAERGILTVINPTIALSAPAAEKIRQILARRFHIHTVLTCHQPRQRNLSQNTSIDESIIVAKRHPADPKPPTRFIHLDRMPQNESDVDALHYCLVQCMRGGGGGGKLANGGGGWA